MVASYNNIEEVEKLVAENKGEIAAIIIEPVGGNMGCILPAPGFLEAIRKICDDEKIVFIFDEVMTGFRLSAGGAQKLLKIDADLITYGKIIGAGLPVGAFGGKRETSPRSYIQSNATPNKPAAVSAMPARISS